MADNSAGKRIKTMRELQGLSGKEFAEMVDISSKYLCEIEGGKRNFSVDILCRMAECLDTSCDYIMFGEDGHGNRDLHTHTVLERMNNQQIVSIQRILKVLCEVSAAFENGELQ